MLPYARHDITNEDIQMVTEALKSGQLTNGSYVKQFETDFKQYCGAKYALAVSSGTAGLHLAIAALNKSAQKTVLIPSLTFAATANCALYEGLDVEFVDIDPATFLIDIAEIKRRIERQPDKYGGVIVVDFAGLPVDVAALRQVCDQYNLWIIEDAAHALGAHLQTVQGEEVVGASSYADVTVFSFHPAKHITTGEGGMVTTRDQKLYERMQLLRSHSMDKSKPSATEPWRYTIAQLGYNYRMSDLNAALGISQLKRADAHLTRRREIARRYDAALAQTGLKAPQTAVGHAYHLYVVQSLKRDELYQWLEAHDIQAQVHYVPLHLQPLYQAYSGTDNLPHTEAYYATSLSLPMFPGLTDYEIQHVINTLQEFAA